MSGKDENSAPTLQNQLHSLILNGDVYQGYYTVPQALVKHTNNYTPVHQVGSGVGTGVHSIPIIPSIAVLPSMEVLNSFPVQLSLPFHQQQEQHHHEQQEQRQQQRHHQQQEPHQHHQQQKQEPQQHHQQQLEPQQHHHQQQEQQQPHQQQQEPQHHHQQQQESQQQHQQQQEPQLHQYHQQHEQQRQPSQQPPLQNQHQQYSVELKGITIQGEEEPESDEDLHICGSCRLEFRHYTQFREHKRSCLQRQRHRREAVLTAVAVDGHCAETVEREAPGSMADTALQSVDIDTEEATKDSPVKPEAEFSYSDAAEEEDEEDVDDPDVTEYTVLQDKPVRSKHKHVEQTFTILQDSTLVSSSVHYPYPRPEEGKTRTVKEAKVQKVLFCSYVGCMFRAKYAKDLARHFKKHTGERPFSCDNCGKSFARPDKLRRHMNIHTGAKPFACTLCSYRTYERSHFTKHTRIHTDERPYQCQMCSYRCKSTSQLTVHLRTHTGDCPFVCGQPTCSASFKTSTDLKRHMKTHLGLKPFKCDYCEHRVICKSNLKQHMRANHRLSEVFNCKSPACAFVSLDKVEMRKHYRLHPEILHCPACPFTTLRHSALIVHETKHQTLAQLRCEYCSYTCRYRNVLSNHKNRRHAHNTPKTAEEEEEDQRQAKKCGKRLKKGETAVAATDRSKIVLVKSLCKPNFKCAICGCQFVRRDSLNSHLNQHRKSGTPVGPLRGLEDGYLGGNISRDQSVKVLTVDSIGGLVFSPQSAEISKPINSIHFL